MVLKGKNIIIDIKMIKECFVRKKKKSEKTKVCCLQPFGISGMLLWTKETLKAEFSQTNNNKKKVPVLLRYFS